MSTTKGIVTLLVAAAAGLTQGGAFAQMSARFSGVASVYSEDYSGQTANGEQYDPQQFTAAHPTLPFGTLLRVSDPCNEHSVTVVINDRGPFIAGRVLDLSLAAAKALGMIDRGLMIVTAAVQQPKAFRLRDLLSN
jgi:rare lipoprotein A